MKKPAALFLCALAFFSCSREEELSIEEINAITGGGIEYILERTVSKPWRGEAFLPGRPGGSWYDAVSADPKSFNDYIAEQDAPTAAVVNMMRDYLADYDVSAREWVPRCAFFEVRVNGEAGTLDVIYTLRDNLYWSYYNSDKKIPVTSDDVIFWYNEIDGNPAFQGSGYTGQFLVMEDGSQAHIDIEKINDKQFVFHFPRIVAEPVFSTNLQVAPRLDYEQAYRERGAEGVRDLFNIKTDPRLIPSMGKWFLAEYTAGQRLVYKRNPAYWNKDANGVSIPYIEEEIIRIIPEENTQYLLFKQGEIETYTPRPEDLDELAGRENAGYTVFNAEGALGASFWTFNQNPKNRDTPAYEWFTKKEFRQAMSSLLNRERIMAQVYRGLAEPKLDIFPEPNPYYNGDITLSYLYNPERALELLARAGMRRDISGVMLDEKKRPVVFDLTIRSESAMLSDIASIIRADLANIGITANIRVIDFQKMVEQLFTTFEWDSMIMGLSGSQVFPTSGSNVWPSSGNLHFWYPLQQEPATDWEARLDFLYNEGAFTIDREKAEDIWDEFQRILLEQCPMIYLLRPRSFFALRNRWDFSNVYFDNLSGFESSCIFLRP
ncbi:MAG: ABC transporter substrate-binding protein [Treponema sp.]|jgi:peptide/nickel transport system substrate-binding protein|nr:ABC transporter substrate-binding protein [Treponema sp.]